MIAPGGTIGILGGGQLGRMLAIAAAQLGYRCHIFAPEIDDVAAAVSATHTVAEYSDVAALARFAASCDVVTYEFENVETDALVVLEKHAPLRPSLRALVVAQSRNAEKSFAARLGGRPSRFGYATDIAGLGTVMADIGAPAIAKTDRFGYDGKGQKRLNGGESPVDIWAEFGGQPLVIEALVDFDHEFSVILVRGLDGTVRYWPTAENVHIDGMLAHSIIPAHPAIMREEAEARAIAAAVADALDYVGVLTCEFFAGSSGPVFNEMAPRVHNSGHWTIEGAVTSQFENHIRAICDLPLGDTALTADGVEMLNIIGAQALDFGALFADPASHVHLYGKAEARAGRKMGHRTRLIFADPAHR